MSDYSTEEDVSHHVGCMCPSCAGGNDNVDPIEGNHQDGFFGGGSNAPTTYGTTEQMVDQLVNGYWENVGWAAHQWGTATVTYSLSSEFSAAEKASFAAAFAMWSDVADINFQEVSSGAQISIVEGDDGSAWSGNTYYNPSTMNMVSNTISIDTDVYGWDDIVTIGKYGFQTVLHEIGHSLGLGHQGNYNGSVNYNDPSQVAYLNDNRQYSIMSYNNANLLGTDHWAQNGVWQYAASPMLYDIMAIQQIYGVNYNTRSGDTTYGFNSNAGRAQFDLSVSSAPFAIWDGAGNDTLDLSGYSTNQTITLVEGAFTSAGYMTNNIVIAFGAVIENAIGGSGNDSITGNAANNILNGGAGNDTLYGSTGSDTLDGDGGTDTASYSLDITAFLISLVNSTTITIRHIADSWIDTLIDIENFVFNGISYTFSEMQDMAYVPETYTMFFKEAGVKYYYQSTDVGTDTLTAAELGYSGTTGNIATFTRTSEELAINITNSSAPSSLTLYGLSGDDNMSVSGTHANFSIIYDGKAGDDTLIITGVIGNDTLWGGAGNDTISAGAGNDKIYGGDDDDILNGDDGDDVISGDAGDDELSGGNGDDYITGGLGDDYIDGGDGDDKIFGGEGADTINGGAGRDIIYGGDDDDDIDGGDGDDIIAGDAGDDTIRGGAGNDKIYGNAGADILYGGSGNDAIYGGIGNDYISGGDDADFLYGEDGDDEIHGDGGGDTIYGGAGNDTIHGGDGNDAIYGGNGNDEIYGDAGNDVIRGEAGDDTIHGGDGDDTIWGDADNDTIYGGAGNDTLYGGTGNDVLHGGDGDDVLSGDAGNDTIHGDDGNDTIYGGAGNDTIHGGAGNDKIFGGNDDDLIYGGDGNDTIRGDAGNDTIYGDAGDDYIYGLDGNDIIYGGLGTDLLWGGAGADTFVFRAIDLDGNYDYIKDFNALEGDRLDIADLLIGFTPGVSDINDFLRFGAPSAKGEVTISIDRDGSAGGHGFINIGKIATGGAALSAQSLYDDGNIVAS